MSIEVNGFRPAGQSVQLIGTATTATAATAIFSGTSATGVFLGAPQPADIRIANLGTSVAFVAFGGTGVTVTSTTGIAIGTGIGAEKFGFAGFSHISAITASGTSTLNITYGGGI